MFSSDINFLGPGGGSEWWGGVRVVVVGGSSSSPAPSARPRSPLLSWSLQACVLLSSYREDSPSSGGRSFEHATRAERPRSRMVACESKIGTQKLALQSATAVIILLLIGTLAHFHTFHNAVAHVGPSSERDIDIYHYGGVLLQVNVICFCLCGPHHLAPPLHSCTPPIH